MSKDYYDILGVSKEATEEDIKKAYKKLAKKYHPDISKETDAEKKFKEVNEAAGVLLDKQKRAQYDRFGSTDGFQGFGGGGGGFNPNDFGINLDDIFEQFGFGSGFSSGFGGFSGGRGRSRRRQKQIDIYEELTISLEDVYFGAEKEIKITRDKKCTTCDGKGAEDPKDIKTCPTCNGNGVVIETQRSILGAIRTERICPECNGSGEIIEKPCITCRGSGATQEKESIEVKIPRGIESGVTLRVPGKGDYDKDQNAYGDLYLKIFIKKDPNYEVERSDLYRTLNVNFVQAIIGDEIEFDHFDKKLSLKVPEGTQPGTVLRVKDKGLPHFSSDVKGDLYVKIDVEIPKKTTKKQKEILMEYVKTLKDKNLMSRLKKFFS